jgi:dihydrofolate synthase/folylpolyglutamate synthase
MIGSVLQEQGYQVGLYTSPHLVSFTERITIDRKEITWDEVVRLTEMLRDRVTRHGVPETFTFFDFTTALALYYFASQGVDVAVLEVGLGGRLDSTNIVDPLAVVITNVTMDHADVLGDSIEKIAWEKAGIIKKGVPTVTGVAQPEALAVLERTGRSKGAPIYCSGNDFLATRGGTQELDFLGRHWNLPGIQLGLLGACQVDNAALALAALEILSEQGYEVTPHSIRAGLREVRWPGRMELWEDSPGVLLDGAHNRAAAAALRRELEGGLEGGRIIMIMGLMQDKDVRGILGELAPTADMIIATRPDLARAMSPHELGDLARHCCSDVVVTQDTESAVRYAKTVARPEDLIVVTGSLFTVGEIRAHLLGIAKE